MFDFEAVARQTNLPRISVTWQLASMTTGPYTPIAKPLHAFTCAPGRLIDVAALDTSVTLFGTKWSSPIFLCPCGSQRAFHPDGELAAARASNTQETLQILSTVATASVREVTHAARRPVWAQLYPTSRWSVTETLVQRAEEAGCPVLVITVNLPALRNAETQKRFRALDKRNCVTCHPNSRPHFGGRHPSFEGIDTSELTRSAAESPYFSMAACGAGRTCSKR